MYVLILPYIVKVPYDVYKPTKEQTTSLYSYTTAPFFIILVLNGRLLAINGSLSASKIIHIVPRTPLNAEFMYGCYGNIQQACYFTWHSY